MAKKIIKWTVIILLGAFFLLWSAVTVGGVYFTVRLRPSDFEDMATLADHPVIPVSIVTEDNVSLSAWYVPKDPERAVILLAGIDSNRRSCVGRAEFFLGEGYSVLLPDLRGSGKSGGGMVTIGWQERKDLIACYQFLREKGHGYIGADGISLGAATICFALPELPDISFVVLESSYDTLANAVRNRLAMFYTPHFIAYPFYVGLAFTIGAPPWRMRPVDFLEHCQAPALIMAGDSEPEIKVSETQSLFDRCASSNKQIHFFAGARHENFLRRYREEYISLMQDFLKNAYKNRKATLSARPCPMPIMLARIY